MKLKRKLLKGLAVYTDDQIWEAVDEAEGSGSRARRRGHADLRDPEWEVFSNPDPKLNSRDFKLRVVEPPKAYRQVLGEGRPGRATAGGPVALIGFTRIESPGDYTELGDFPEEQRVAAQPEGSEMGADLGSPGRRGLPPVLGDTPSRRGSRRPGSVEAEFFEAHRRWRKNRGLEPDDGYPDDAVRAARTRWPTP